MIEEPKLVEETPFEVKQKESLFEFAQASARVERMIKAYQPEEVETTRRRNVRRISIDRESLILRGALKPDETYIPIRVCDTNIKREQPPYIAFLKQSRRLAIFRNVTQPNLSSDNIEKAFTEVMTYDSWEVPHFKCLDGAMTHGWAAIEIELDYSRPGGVNLAYIEHDKLIIPLEALDIQNCEHILIRYDLNAFQLLDYVKNYGFDKEQVDLVIQKQSASDEEKTIPVYKRYFKYEGVVYVCWYAKNTTGWLAAPKKLFCGVKKQVQRMVPQPPMLDVLGRPVAVPPQVVVEWVEVDETDYPIEVLYYDETEQSTIKDHKGRVFLDEYKQEAASVTWTNVVNACNRAAGVYASPRDMTTGAAPKQTDTIIESGRLYNAPLDFWSPPWPDPMMVTIVQQLDVQNSSETNQPAWAVNNRQDSRKTAAEINAAQQQTSLVNSVQVTIYSTFIRRVYTRAWRIVQSLALQGKIVFMPLPQGGNDLQSISFVYDIRAAGDIDVVQRQEKLQKMAQIFAMVQGTAAALPILQDMIKLGLPEDGDKYVNIMNQAMELQRQQQAQQALQMQQMAANNPQMLQQMMNNQTPQQ